MTSRTQGWSCRVDDSAVDDRHRDLQRRDGVQSTDRTDDTAPDLRPDPQTYPAGYSPTRVAESLAAAAQFQAPEIGCVAFSLRIAWCGERIIRPVTAREVLPIAYEFGRDRNDGGKATTGRGLPAPCLLYVVRRARRASSRVAKTLRPDAPGGWSRTSTRTHLGYRHVSHGDAAGHDWTVRQSPQTHNAAGSQRHPAPSADRNAPPPRPDSPVAQPASPALL